MDYRAKIIILTGAPIEREDLGRFVIDLESLQYHKDRFSIDFNHDDEIPIGVLEHIRYEQGVGLVGDAIFSSPNQNDKASEIIQRLSDDFPFEVSPTLELDLTNMQTLEEGEEAEVNGQIIKGQVDIYRNVQFRGCGVVLFGTDPNTSVTSLKQTNLLTLNTKGTNIMKKTKCEQEVKEEPIIADTPVADDGGEVKEQPEYLALLESMLTAFGEEAGLRYFRSNMSMEEAEKADYEELKSMRAKLAAPADEEPEVETAPTDEEEPAVEDDDKEELKAELKSLKAELSKLRAAFSSRGESTPVSGSTARTPDTRDALHKMADKIKANGIKRA